MMAAHSSGAMRSGPISIITLAIVLCIAVMGVLSAATSHASLAISEKQGLYTRDMYRNEKDAWALVADVDTALLPVRQTGGGLAAAEKAVAAILPENADMKGGTVQAVFSTPSGRMLDVMLEITPDAKYRILKWAASTERDDVSTDDKLWTGR